MFTDIALHPDLESNLASSGYIEATEVQQRAVPLLLEGQDLLVSAPTGSGKTGNYGVRSCIVHSGLAFSFGHTLLN